jgi:hypothetical protein
VAIPRRHLCQLGDLALVAILAACNSTAPCSQQNRSITSIGAIGAYGSRELYAQIEVHQVQGQSRSDRLAWILEPDVHTGHVTGVTLYDSRAPSRALATFPIQSASAAIFSRSAATPGSPVLGATPGEICDVISSGTARVHATSDLASPAVLDVPLSVNSKSEWGQMGCAG